MATANEVFVNPNPSASLIWSSMILLKDVITNAEHISLAPENLGRQAPANKFPIFFGKQMVGSVYVFRLLPKQ